MSGRLYFTLLLFFFFFREEEREREKRETLKSERNIDELPPVYVP